MSVFPSLEDFDEDPVSIVLEHLELGCPSAGLYEIGMPLNASLQRGEAKLHFTTRGRIELQLHQQPGAGPGEKRVIEERTGFVVTGPATYLLTPILSDCDKVTLPCEMLIGLIDYSAVEFPEEKRFLPSLWGGVVAVSAAGAGSRESGSFIDEVIRFARQEAARPLACQLIAVELARRYLIGPPGTRGSDGKPERVTALATIVRHPPFAPLVGILLRNLSHNWGADELARAMGLGRRTFCSQLREISHLAPFELLTVLRMQHVSRILALPDASLKQVPSLVGYRSLPAFASVFVKTTGLTLNESRHIRRAHWVRSQL